MNPENPYQSPQERGANPNKSLASAVAWHAARIFGLGFAAGCMLAMSLDGYTFGWFVLVLIALVGAASIERLHSLVAAAGKEESK